MSSEQQQNGSKPKNRNFRRTQTGGRSNGESGNGRKAKKITGNPDFLQKEIKSGKKSNIEKKVEEFNAREEDDDTELCIICARVLVYASLSPCNHTTCHVCSFRQRALYEKKSCLICRTENDRLTFTDNIDAQYSEITDFSGSDDKFGIDFTSDEVKNATLDLLKYACPLCPDNEQHVSTTYKKYNEHLKSAHNRMICLICAGNKHSFPREMKIYTANQLKNHHSRGDSEGFKGHPMCAFCTGKRFYSDDELYIHMRNDHEKCHICDRIDHTQPQYFKDYEQLFEHFRTSHYVCTVQSCLDDKFVVFKDDMELQAHILKEHGDILRGKPKFFQSELSTFISAPSQVIRERDSYNYDMGSVGSSNIEESSNPEVNRLRMNERAKHYLNSSLEGFQKFETLNENYDSSVLTASQLVQEYKKLFTDTHADIYLLVHNLSALYPKSSKKFKDLDVIYQEYEQTEKRKNALPSLLDDHIQTVPGGAWGSSTGRSKSHSSIKNLNQLPSLGGVSSSFDPFKNPNKAPVYKGLRQSPKPVVSATQRQTPMRISARPTASNRVEFNGGSTTKAATPSWGSQPSSNSSSKNKLADLNLPTLPAPKPKVYIPPVHEPVIPDPKKWGQKGEPAPQLTEEQQLLESLNLNGNSKSKKKGKQKQLLFHIGV